MLLGIGFINLSLSMADFLRGFKGHGDGGDGGGRGQPDPPKWAVLSTKRPAGA
jgi:hypothetical protein